MIENQVHTEELQDSASIESELKRVLSSQTFPQASRMRELLDFAVKGTLRVRPLASPDVKGVAV